MQPLYRSLPNEKRNGDAPEVIDHAPVNCKTTARDDIDISASVTEEGNIKRKRNRKNNLQERIGEMIEKDR